MNPALSYQRPYPSGASPDRRRRRRQLEPFEVIFHGGEPLLIGAARFESVCRELREALPIGAGLGMQTNGVLLSENVARTCVRHGVSVSVSIDGPAAVHDRHRPDRRGRASHSAVIAGIERFKAFPGTRGLLAGVLAVIDLQSNPVEVYGFLKSLERKRRERLPRFRLTLACPVRTAGVAAV